MSRAGGPVLVVNAGSSTLKLAVLGGDGDRVLAGHTVDDWDGAAAEPIQTLASEVEGVTAVGHRVVHGGDRTAPVMVTDEVDRELRSLSSLAPLHQPPALDAVAAAREALPEVPHVACFDTAFHATIPVGASTYALPADWRRRWPLRRYGFHGLSHQWVAERAAALAGRAGHHGEQLRIVSCHLGSGASACAVAGDRSVATTMGFTPLEGLVMASRSGSVDPGLVLWLVESGGLAAADVRNGLEHRSGLAGLSGTSGDMREVLDRRRHGDGDATLAFDVYVHRLRQEIAAMAAALGGLDVLAFTGGVGENAAEVRSAAAAGLAFLGVAVDEERNAGAHGDADVTAPGAPAATVVVTAREDAVIARSVRRTVRSELEA